MHFSADAGPGGGSAGETLSDCITRRRIACGVRSGCGRLHGGMEKSDCLVLPCTVSRGMSAVFGQKANFDRFASPEATKRVSPALISSVTAGRRFGGPDPNACHASRDRDIPGHTGTCPAALQTCPPDHSTTGRGHTPVRVSRCPSNCPGPDGRGAAFVRYSTVATSSAAISRSSTTMTNHN